MATHNTLSPLFTDVADAIRTKTGDSGQIVADNFPTEILAIPSAEPRILPEEYTKKNYIEATENNTYFKTGITGCFNMEVKAKVSFSDASQIRCFFGYHVNSASSNTRFSAGTQAGNWSIAVGSQYPNLTRITLNQEYEVLTHFESGNSYIQDINTETKYVSTTSTGTGEQKEMSIFRREGSNEQFIGKMYYIQIYIRGVLVFDGEPCVRNSDNVYGMYDYVSKSFFTSEGAGAFSGG